MDNLKEKEIRDYLNTNTKVDMLKSEAVCEISEKFEITLAEAFDVYDEYEQFERLIRESDESVKKYIAKSEFAKRMREGR